MLASHKSLFDRKLIGTTGKLNSLQILYGVKFFLGLSGFRSVQFASQHIARFGSHLNSNARRFPESPENFYKLLTVD